jgi:hypothetical protein
LNFFWFNPNAKSLPWSLTINGFESSIFFNALVIPLAIVAQFTIPPNTFINMAFTCGSLESILYA